jgi:hypothetical protein
LQHLRNAAGALSREKALCESVWDLFPGNDTDAAARLGDVCERIGHEHEYIERLAAKSES